MKKFLVTLLLLLTPFLVEASTAKVLVVGGGGGGGAGIGAYNLNGGGGGAGGYQYNSALTVTDRSYTITVGAGGSAGVAGPGGAGSDSVFDSSVTPYTAHGGGYGGGPNSGPGGNGASGGGACTTPGGTGTSGEGHDGGVGGGNSTGGGGGGASVAGHDNDGGGDGTSNSITGSAVTYAGGGGGGDAGASWGAGGAGGGGRGGGNGTDSAVAGTDGLGGGGGGGSYGNSRNGKVGGSGVVLISYLTADFASTTYTGTGNFQSVDGTSTIIHFISSGTWTVIAATSSPTPTGLLVNDLANPWNVGTTSPYFSARYVNASTTALASSYQLQVDPTGAFTSPYWDSGKKTLASSTPVEMRTPNIYATTTFVGDGTKYFWRIKFWDQYDGESGWSTTTDSFVRQFGGDYLAKIDDGSFLRYNLASSTWTAYDKRGTKYTFGASTSTELSKDVNATTTEIFRWMLEKVEDTNGNSMTYSYVKDGEQIYPYKISYTNGTSTTGIHEVEFVRESRSDVATTSYAGFAVNTAQRIKEILVRTNGQLTHRYQLGYKTGDNGTRSLLASLQESGWSASAGTTTLPALQFSYATSTNGWAENTDPAKWGLPGPQYYSTDVGGVDAGARTFDVNGDALPDLVWKQGSYTNAYINTGKNWATSTAYTSPLEFGSVDTGVRLGDVNGDGYLDEVQSWYNYSPPTWTRTVYLGSANGWTQDTTGWKSPVYFATYNAGETLTQGARLVDVNGDGLADIVQAPSTTIHNIYINNGSQFVLDPSWNYPSEANMLDSNNDAGIRIIDVNGDGLADIIAARNSVGGSADLNKVYLNNGHGWDPAGSSWSAPWSFANANGDPGTRLADVNGDGLTDFVTNNSNVFLNTGEGWASSIGGFPTDFLDGTTHKDLGITVDDFNGDGLPDVSKNTVDAQSTVYKKVWIKNGVKADLLTGIKNEKGGTVTIGYGRTSQLDSTGAKPNPYLQIGLDVVKTIATNPGFGGAIATSTYAYGDGRYYFSGQGGRYFTSFATTTETNVLGYTTRTFSHTGFGSDSANGEYSDHVAKMGKPYRIEILDGTTTAATLYSRTINKWARAVYDSGRNFVKLISSLTETFDGDATHRDTGEEKHYDDTTGNTIDKVSWGEVTGASDGTWTDTGTDKATTTYSYATSSALSALSLPSRELVVEQSGNTVKDTKWYYDGQSLGVATNGNQTKEEKLKSSGEYINTQKTFNNFGNVVTATDPRGNVTTYSFDAYNLYPATVTNALSQSRSFLYDYATGKVATTTDENSRVFQSDYDGLGRTVKEWQPDFTSPTTLVAKSEYTYTDSTTTPPSVFERVYLNSATSTDLYNYTDGLARALQTKREAESGNGWVTKDIIYNAIGSIDQESLPYFTSSASNSTATTAPALFTTYRYDPSGRVTTVADVFGTTTNAYSDWRLTTTDPLTHKKDFIKDAYGNLATVVEYPSTGATTTYAWNLLGKLTKITDASSNIRNFTYDNLGRLIGSEDLHASGDSTFGTTSREYDDASNLIQSYSPLGLATNYVYDALNRLTTEDSTTTANGLTDLVYRYDTCTNGVARLCEVNANSGATTTYAYNPIGLIATEAKKIGATWATTTKTFLRNGTLDSLIYPNNYQVSYLYNDAGDLNRVLVKSPASSTWKTVLESTNYGPNGLPTMQDYGNNTKTITTYDQTKRYRLIKKETYSTSTTPGSPETLAL